MSSFIYYFIYSFLNSFMKSKNSFIQTEYVFGDNKYVNHT